MSSSSASRDVRSGTRATNSRASRAANSNNTGNSTGTTRNSNRTSNTGTSTSSRSGSTGRSTSAGRNISRNRSRPSPSSVQVPTSASTPSSTPSSMSTSKSKSSSSKSKSTSTSTNKNTSTSTSSGINKATTSRASAGPSTASSTSTVSPTGTSTSTSTNTKKTTTKKAVGVENRTNANTHTKTNKQLPSSTSASTSTSPPSMSSYLHGILQPILQHDAPAEEKIHSIDRINSFLTGERERERSTSTTSTSKRITSPVNGKKTKKPSGLGSSSSLEEHLFSPLVSDVHLSIHPPNSNRTNTNKNRNNTSTNTSTNTGNANANADIIDIQSGIQLPVIDWHREFRKGYSLLMWVCLNDYSYSEGEGEGDSDNNSDSDRDVMMMMEPQILYRFATSPSSKAFGVQATIHRDAAYYDSNNNETNEQQQQQQQRNKNLMPVIIRIETLRPLPPSSKRFDETTTTTNPYNNNNNNNSNNTNGNFSSPSKTMGVTSTQMSISTPSSSSVLPNTLTTKTTLLPVNQWTLICVQHSFPYLKRPVVSVSVNGVEIEKGEVSYPTLGGEAGEVMLDNYILCNIPRHIGDSSGGGGSGSGKSSDKGSSILEISRVDFAGFGLFKEAIPTLLQAILCEHGPCPSADGVIPSVPPVAQCRDGIVINAATRGVIGGGMININDSRNRGHGSGAGGSAIGGIGGGGGVGSPRRVAPSGPFSLSSHRTVNASEGRGIGIPLSTGVQLTEDTSHKGELFLQQLLSKLVVGLNGSSVFQIGDRIGLRMNIGCNVGSMADIKMIGIAQAKAPNRRAGEGKKNNDIVTILDDQHGTVAKGIGNISMYHASKEFLELEKKHGEASRSAIVLPSYNLPNSSIAEINPMPSFLSTYLSLDSISYILQPFHLALPPSGYAHSLQMEVYHNSFDHLYDLIVYNDGAFAAKLINLFVTNLYMGGRMREEVIHCGGLHSLVALLRRVLLRASRLGILTYKRKNGDRKLWQIFASQESPDDELKDINGKKESSPSYIPMEITKACRSLLIACCGPTLDVGKRWKRPPLSVHIRRTSDIALTAVFGLALDLDLWGGDPIAAAAIIQELANLYCTDGFDNEDNPPELTEKYDSGYGRLVRGQISIQHLLDMIRLRFGNEIIIQSKKPKRTEALKSLACSFSRIFYMLLKYSLFKQISQGEHDISALVAALSDCPLGSVGAHIILSALKDVMIYCEIVPNHSIGSVKVEDEEDIPQSQSVKALLGGAISQKKPPPSVEQSMKLKRIKSEIAGRLARNLLIAQFHDVVAPMLLSRTVFDGRRTIADSGADQLKNQQDAKTEPRLVDGKDRKCLSFEWQNHWITTLEIFIWVTSVARSEGEKIAHTAGDLLLQSGQAGSLSGCLLCLDNLDFISLLANPIPTPTSALTPGGISGQGAHAMDSYNRLRIIHQLLGGLVASLVSNYRADRNENEANKQKRPKLLTRSAVKSLEHFMAVVVCMVLYVQDKETEMPSNDSRRRRQVAANSSATEKAPVRFAVVSVPPLVLAAVLLESPIQEFKREYNSDGSWDFVENNGPSTNASTSSLDEQLRILTSCQTNALQTAALLIAKAMVVGGGEATTNILRDVVSVLTSVENVSHNDVGHGANASSIKVKNHLLCRLISMVLVKVVARKHKEDDPWKSVELCSATARLCDLVEEKKLLQSVNGESTGEKKCADKLTLDQVRLLCALLDVMEAGRENTGWCQIILSDPTGNQDPSRTEMAPLTKKERPSLVEMLGSPEVFIATKHVDYEMLATTDEVYHLIDDDNLASIEIFDKYQTSLTSTNPQSFSTSKLLLPILQPSLRIVLGCLGEIRSSAIVHYTAGNGGKSLLSILIEELRSTLTAALVGLAFPHARDLCLSSLSLLRKGIEHHEKCGDEFVAIMYRDLFVAVVEEIRIRYENERKKKEVAELFSYSSQAPSTEVANSQEVERLLLGNTLVASNSGADDEVDRNDDGHPLLSETNQADASDDFIIFPGHAQNNPQVTTAMGWNGYKGFGLALEKCVQLSTSENGDKSIAALSILSSYLDTWDEKQVIDDEESELVELFDTNASTTDKGSSHDSGFATAADSMTSYIELASSENGRMAEIQTFLLPYKRYNSLSFSESFCWKSFLEFFAEKECGIQIFERCVADAGRDYGGRLLTIPIHPQFSRTIPKQLDHSLQISTIENTAMNDALNTSTGCLSVDIDELNTLVQQGNLKILDITKKHEEEDDVLNEDDSEESDNVLVSKPSMDSTEVQENDNEIEKEEQKEELYLGFPERSDEDIGLISEVKDEATPQKENISLSMRSDVETNQLNEDEGQGYSHTFFMSSFANPPNSTASSLQGHLHHGTRYGSTVSGWGGLVEDYYDNCVHVKAEGNRKGTLLLTPTYLIFEYDDPSGLTESEVQAIEEMKKKSTDADSSENDNGTYDRMIQHYIKTAALRPKSIRWNIHELSHVYLRRYRLRDSALEMFFIPSGGSMSGGTGLLSALSSIWLDFGPGSEGNIRRDDAASAIMKRAPSSTVKQWPDKSAHFLHEHLRNITLGWVKGRINNFDYLLSLNILSGRSFNDLCQYPVFPWVLSNYTSEDTPDLNDESNFRDLTKPMGALNPQRLKEFIERFESFDDAMIPPFMYGSHYSTSAGVVLHFLVRMHPFASLHRQLQGGHFDVADRLFSSVSRTWDMCTGQSAAEVKELTPEWYCNPSFLKNTNQFKLGTSQDGESLGDVILPPWAKGSPEKFVEVMRCALESDICTKMLPNWIDLIFGRKQQGPASVEAHNVFFYLTYYGSCDVASIEDDDLRVATELQIAHFGQCPMQLFWRPHVSKLPKSSTRRRLSLSELLNLYDIQSNSFGGAGNSDSQLIFGSAPLEYWLHLSAPPPGPHASIIAVRLVVPDRCLAVDAQGIFHFFRFGWKSHLEPVKNNDDNQDEAGDLFSDKGVFVAQRELPHFRSIPRLHFAIPKQLNKERTNEEKLSVVVAISKCIFNRSLLVVSDGDGKGSLCFQFVDPSKGIVEGQVLVPSAHSSRISALHMDPIGAAAGVGGAGGELAIAGSEDGTATVWRFISNAVCTLPLRPRLRLKGHRGMKINAVAVSSALHICLTVSALRCCVFSLSNGAVLSSISPQDNDFPGARGVGSNEIRTESHFADTNAVSICATGFITLVCITKYYSPENELLRRIVTLQLFTFEGVHIGSKALESWRGIPHKIVPTYDGRGVMVCSGGGISIHLISAIKPLHFVDEWKVADDDEIHSGFGAYDIDFGPSLSRPVVAVTGLSSGSLRIHAFKGVSEWSEEVNKRSTMSEAVGNALAKPAEKVKGLLGVVKGKGSKVVGLGKEIGREAVSGFLGDVFGKKIEM